MGRRGRGWWVGLGLLLAPASAASETHVPVVVTVVGEGPPVRVLVDIPCHSYGERVRLDRMVAVGQTVQTAGPGPCVCFQHTHGAFRQTDFMPVRRVCRHHRAPSDAYFDGDAFRLTLQADRPPG